MKKKRMAEGLLKGLRQAAAMERGELSGRERVRTLSRPAPRWTRHEIKRLRQDTFHMSQPVFASLLNVKPATVRAWEQGQRTPDGAAARLLEVLSQDIEIAEKLAS
ncbi:MAG: transcriptional regulator [Deltaproteobacteria bacterium]|nr:transcriptional regulator [Deltaproteobacteria bacterium]